MIRMPLSAQHDDPSSTPAPMLPEGVGKVNRPRCSDGSLTDETGARMALADPLDAPP